MSYPINYPTPQGANIQIFKRGNVVSDWVKPQGASFVWFTLIGPGGNGGSPVGGGSGAVTNCMVPAFLIPDVLRVKVGYGIGAIDTEIRYQQKDTTGYKLLEAKAASGTTGGVVSVSNFFSAMGFFQSVAGQNGDSGAVAASATTFLSGGSQTGSSVTANYGYSTLANGNFFMQPIIVGVGGIGADRGGIGCGGGDSSVGGGDGMVVIITW